MSWRDSTSDRFALIHRGAPPDINCVDQALRILPASEPGTPDEFVVIFGTGGAGEPMRENYIAICRSFDAGYTWTQAEPVIRYDDRATLVSEVYLHDGRLVVFVTTHGGRFDHWEVWTIESTDRGHTWSEPVPFEPLPRRTFVRNRFIMTSGRWVLPYQTYPTKGDPDISITDDGSRKAAYAGTLVSDNEGRTWQKSNIVGPINQWAENNVAELSDGRLVMLVRADGTGCLWRSESRDAGATWSDLVRSNIPNPGSKFRLWRLPDGRIALIHNPNPNTNHPNSKHHALCNRNPLALWISDDDIHTWSVQRVLTDFPGMLAYPDGEMDSSAEWIHFAFDYNRHDVIYCGARIG